MNTVQQCEALHYFRAHAEDWSRAASSNDEQNVNVIQQRNGYVQKAIAARSKTRSVLDVGCGTGELVHDIAKEGFDAVGVDFASEMIEIADKVVDEIVAKLLGQS